MGFPVIQVGRPRMASTELGFLALPQFLKGTPELSILPSLPTSDPDLRRHNREATGDGALVPSSATGLVVLGERTSAEAGGEGPAGGGAGIGGAW